MGVGKAPRWGRLREMSVLSRLLLSAWLAGSLLWTGLWVNYFYEYCDFNGTFACVVGGFLETIFYSLPEALMRVLGPPTLALILGLVVRWALKTRSRREAELQRQERLSVE
jgi:hypothetical protein